MYPKKENAFILKLIILKINFRINLCTYPKISGGESVLCTTKKTKTKPANLAKHTF